MCEYWPVDRQGNFGFKLYNCTSLFQGSDDDTAENFNNF